MGIFDRFKKKEAKSEAKSVAPVDSGKKPKPADQPQPIKKPVAGLKTASRIKVKADYTDQLIIRPVVTEKATYLSQFSKYVFEVPTRINRLAIIKAIKLIYNVTPIKVNIINQAGKEVSYGRTQGRTKNWKKAIVTLKPGETIKIQDGV